MAIQDDFLIDATLKRIVHQQTFVNGKPPNIYTANAFYTFIQDEADEPSRMIDTVPISAQTSLQYRMENEWFIDDETVKTILGGSLETAGWTKSGAAGITQLRWQSGSSDPPTAADIGEVMTGGTSGATGLLLAVDVTKRIAWVRNTSATQFDDSTPDNVTSPSTAWDIETTFGLATGESIWGNLFTVGSVEPETEVYIGQEDDYMAGTGQGGGGSEAVLGSIAPWWDVDVDFVTPSPNPVNAGGIDVLIKVQEADVLIDAGRLEVDARQLTVLYSSFKLLLTAGQGVGVLTVPGQDLNATLGDRRVGVSSIASGPIVVGDIIQDSVAAQNVNRAVITAVETGPDVIEYYLIGDLTDFSNSDTVFGKSPSSLTFTIDTGVEAFSDVGPGLAVGISIAPGHNVGDVDQDAVNEPYSILIDCSDERLDIVYRRVMFLVKRGELTGILPDAETGAAGEEGQFYEATGEVLALIDAEGSSGLAEDTFVTGSLSGATAVVVAKEFGGSPNFDYVVLTQVKGTFEDNDVLDLVNSPVGNSNTIAGTPTLLPSQTANPFGQFAGGNWFLARGVNLSNVNALDANLFQTTDILGVLRVPPAQVTVVMNGVVAGDRVLVALVEAGGSQVIDTDENGVNGTPAQGVEAVTLDSSPPADKPTNETLHIIDAGFDERYRVASIAGAVVTLVSIPTGTATGGSDIDTLEDTGSTFQADNVEIGMLIRKTNVGGNDEIFKVLRVVSETELDVAPWEGTRETATAWSTGNTFEINRLAYVKAGTEDAYIPYMDRIATSTTESVSLTFVSTREVLARDRFSSTIIGGQKILPFEQLSIQITTAGLTVAARRDDDNIAA